MSSILTSVLVSAGKHLIGGLVGEDSTSQKVDRSEQLARFDQRLDSVMNPEKTAFKTYLTENNANNKPSLEYMQKRLKDGLLFEPEVSEFIEASGGKDAPLTIEKAESGYSLVNQSGEVFSVEAGSMAENMVDKLYRIESVLQMAAVDPGIDINRAVDLSFEVSNLKPETRVTISGR